MTKPRKLGSLGASTFLSVSLLAGCGPALSGPASAPTAQNSKPILPEKKLAFTLIGTNDLHGHIQAAPLLAGYLAILRKDRDVVLVDAGDMFQGTLESNLAEGAPLRNVYDALRYDAAAIGNHEFDYGPEGPHSSPQDAAEDPFGALKKLANPSTSEPKFPFLSVNLGEIESSSPTINWPNVRPSIVIVRGGLRIGIVGGTTGQTLTTTLAANVKTLKLLPLATTAAAEIARLRTVEHADVVILVAHAGGRCSAFHGNDAEDHCEKNSEIFEVAEHLATRPETTPDAIVAGHTHAPMATRHAGIPIVEAYSYGSAFDRIDFEIDGATKKVQDAHIFPPQSLCANPEGGHANPATCAVDSYENQPVIRDSGAVLSITEAAQKAAAEVSAKRLGPTLSGRFSNDHDHESSLGNLATDLMREAFPEADVAVMNGGGLRAPLPAGPLTFGSFFEAFPFDNRVAMAKMPASRLQTLLEDHVRGAGSTLSFSGVSIHATCTNHRPRVTLTDAKGVEIPKDRVLTVVGSDFLFTGGDAFWGHEPAPPYTERSDLLRDAMVAVLRKKTTLDPANYLKTQRRFVVSERPLQCD